MSRPTLEHIRDKVQAASYHRNYRQACIDINEIVLDALAGNEATLDAAWSEAQAALPDGATIIVARYSGRGDYPSCEAVGESPDGLVVRSALTPAAALRDVVAAVLARS